MERKLLIVPDVHGRTFWKEVENTEDTPIVFLGDYLDPYTSIEGITNKNAIDNFSEIVQFARENRDRVTLLYGNHDSYAFHSERMCSCRHDWKNIKKITKMFDDNSDLFQMAYETTVGGRRFLLTHAGVNPYWVQKHRGTLGDDFGYTADELNNIPKSGILDMLCDVSYYRGGPDVAGSFVWTDIHEHVADIGNIGPQLSRKIPENLVQVFGHTWLQKPIRVDCGPYEICCLDVREVFYIDGNGSVRYLKDDKVV